MAKIIMVVIIIIVVVITGVYGVLRHNSYKTDRAFLSTLKGKIVYRKWVGGRAALALVDAGGAGERVLYQSSDPENGNVISPEWSADGSRITFFAMKDGRFKKFSVDESGGNLTAVDTAEPPVATKSHAPDLVVIHGELMVKKPDGSTVSLYKPLSLMYDADYSPGASDARWSPDKKYVVFSVIDYFGSRIMIADTSGRRTYLTDGTAPDWKQ